MPNGDEAALDALFHALSDPTRRAVVDRLRAGSARVTDLAAPFDLALSSFSRHLKVLEGAGVVQRTREGREHVFRLVPRALEAITTWVAGGPGTRSGPEDRRLLDARALARQLEARMAAVRLALSGGADAADAFSPDALVARQLVQRMAADAGLAGELALALALYDRLLAEIAAREAGGPGPTLETLTALGSLAYAWDAEPAFQAVWLFDRPGDPGA